MEILKYLLLCSFGGKNFETFLQDIFGIKYFHEILLRLRTRNLTFPKKVVSLWSWPCLGSKYGVLSDLSINCMRMALED